MEARSIPIGRPQGRGGDPQISRWRESRLIRAARRGDERALETLFDAHWTRSHRTAYLVCRDAAAAEDIAQEAFLAAIRRLDRFDYRRPFAPWLHRIVVNRAIDHARAAKLRGRPTDPIELNATVADAGDGARTEISEELLTGIGALEPERRALIALRYLLELTPGEIAEMLEIPRGTVNSRLRRALDELATALEGSR
ncbi:MAG: RNA polymerase sigma factor [Solirubrobacterales bacterium]